MPERPARRLEYGAFRDPPNQLFRDYVSGAQAVAPYFDGAQWDLSAVLATAEKAASRSLDRAAVTAALVRQQEQRGALQAAERAKQLASDGSVAIVSGQQPVIFGGPLLVLYKALAVVDIAARVEQRRGRPAVPVFWVAADDHDFAEMRSVAVWDGSGRLRSLRYDPSVSPAGQPASHVLLDQSTSGLIGELGEALRDAPHAALVLERTASCYRPGATLAGAFAALLSAVIPELVVLDPSDPALKALMRPVLRRELSERSPTSRLAIEIGPRLLSAGYHQQVPLRPGFLNLFLLVDGERRALAAHDDGIEIRGLDRRMSLSQAVQLLDAEPERWSPAALLRPLAQDHILPTAAYVGGPAEIAYHAQLGPAYSHFGLVRPVLVPRPGITLLEAATSRALEADRLTLPELQSDVEAILAGWARAAHPEIEEAFSRARATLSREMTAVEEALGKLDPTLRAAADSARGRALHQIETLYEKAVRALKKLDQVRSDRLRRTRDTLFPNGNFQEREIAFVGPLARHGDNLLQTLRTQWDPWARGHQIIGL